MTGRSSRLLGISQLIQIPHLSQWDSQLDPPLLVLHTIPLAPTVPSPITLIITSPTLAQPNTAHCHPEQEIQMMIIKWSLDEGSSEAEISKDVAICGVDRVNDK